MNYRKFGEPLDVSEIGYVFGVWAAGPSDDQESLDSLQHSVDLGCNFFVLPGPTAKATAKNSWAVGASNPAHAQHRHQIPPKNRLWPSRREFSLDDCFPQKHSSVFERVSQPWPGSLDLIQFHTGRKAGWKMIAGYRAWMTCAASVRSAQSISNNRWETLEWGQSCQSGWIDAAGHQQHLRSESRRRASSPLPREGRAVIARLPYDECTLTGNLTLIAIGRRATGKYLFCPET